VLPAILILAALFGALFLARLGAARRAELLRRWPALLLAAASVFALARGAVWPAVALAAGAVAAWVLWPRLSQRARPRDAAASQQDKREAEARAILGVGPDAGASEIRQAYRLKMAHAHPDRGGGHPQAARLTAARDLLLKKKA
jgi:hypothetical protein